MHPTVWLAVILVAIATPLVVIEIVSRVSRYFDGVLEDILKWLPLG